MQNKWAITTSKSMIVLPKQLQQMCDDLEIPFIARENQSLEKIWVQYDLEELFVLENSQLFVYCNGEKFGFHPGMTVPRLKALALSLEDPFARLIGIGETKSFLDCTLGLANDAIFVSSILAEDSKIVGLESSPTIYCITKYGLLNDQKGSHLMQSRMRNIEVKLGNYIDLLPLYEKNQFDILYFDPMFDYALQKSTGIKGLRPFANYQQLTNDSLDQALRVAKEKVIVKYRKGAKISLHFDQIEGGKYSAISYGVLYK